MQNKNYLIQRNNSNQIVKKLRDDNKANIRKATSEQEKNLLQNII